MGAALGALLRPLVTWITQIVVTTLIADAIAAMLKKVVAIVAQHYNIPEDDAKVIVANQLIDIAALVGVGTGVLKAKLGVKAADYLGLSTASATKKAVSTKAAAAVKAADAAPNATAKAKSLLGVLGTGEFIWKGVLFTMLLQQVGDWFIFGRPQLQGYIDAVFGKDTVKLPTASDNPPGFTKATWEQYYLGLEQAGIVGIEGGAVAATLIYSRDQLVQLVWWGYSQLLKEGASPTETAIRKKIQPNLRFASNNTPSQSTTLPYSNTSSKPSTSTATPVQQVQVFTGVVTSGTLGTPAEFVSRPDDMINSTSELKSAAKNNLAAFITALPGKFFYEVAVVNSVKTKTGFTQKGEAVQIVSGYNKDGTKRYKTVYNKFAVMKVGVTGNNGKPVVLTTITLGPVNVVDFQPTAGDLQNIAGAITSELFTSNIGDIKQINTPNDVKVSNDTTSPPPPPEVPPVASQPAPSASIRYRVTTGGISLNLRAEADLAAEILAKIPDGTLLTLDSNTTDHVQDGYTWHLTNFNGTNGYVAREYLVPETVNATPAPAPKPAAPTGPDLSKLSSNQKSTYDSLVAVGASPQAAYDAAILVQASSTGGGSSNSSSSSQSSSSSSSSSKTYSFAAKNGSTYKVKDVSESAARKKAAAFAAEDGTSLK